MSRVDTDYHVYVRPDPVTVARIWDEYGADNACERWGWVSEETLANIAIEGRAKIRRDAGIPARTSSALSTTIEDDRLLIEAVVRHGCISGACRENGKRRSVISRALSRADHPAPVPDRRALGLVAQAHRRRSA